jgi:HrpA-like RNA helicase
VPSNTFFVFCNAWPVKIYVKMSRPPIITKGSLASPRADPAEQAELDKWVPIEYMLEWFRVRRGKTGMENRVLILKSETASGKSTVVPPRVYIEFIMRHPSPYTAKSAGLICTQPRTLTAMENVRGILEHNKELRLGDNIGWSTQYNKFRPRGYGLLSATVGTLTQQLKVMTDDELMAKYAFILIDETHERDLQTDMTIYMLKNFLMRNAHRQSCPFVVLMSATFDPKSFLVYFNIREETNYIWCRGQANKFTEAWGWYAPAIVGDYCELAVECVEKIVREAPNEGPARADVLIFMPGLAEINATWKGLHELNAKLVADGINPIFPLRLDSKSVAAKTHEYMVAIILPLVGQSLEVAGANYQPSRRVIISTNIAETGLTLDDLKYVIDAGYNKEVEYNPVLGVASLLSKPAPRSRVTQRRGRAGRKFPGVFFPMYSLETFKDLPEIQLPQILLNDISAVFLDMMAEQFRAKTLSGDTDPIFRVEDVDMIDSPATDALVEAMELHHALGLVTLRGDRLTPLGEMALKFTNQNPRVTRMLMAAFYWKSSPLDIASIAAYLTVTTGADIAAEQSEEDAFAEKPKEPVGWPGIYALGLGLFKNSFYAFRAYAADDFLHGVVLFDALGKAAAAGNLEKWCAEVNLSYASALQFVAIREEFILQALAAEVNMFTYESNRFATTTTEDLGSVIARLKHCIYDGFRQNLLTRRTGKYYTCNGLEVAIPRIIPKELVTKEFMSGPFGAISKISPKYVVYNTLSLKQDRETLKYAVKCDAISVMDGFVSCDSQFLR